MHAPIQAAILVILANSLHGCGIPKLGKSEKKSSSPTGSSLHQEIQDRCNAEGKFYDNIFGPDECSSEYTLAKWECSRKGIGKQLELSGALEKSASTIDKYLRDGYSIHQCGDSFREMIVILTKPDGSKNGATVEMQSFGFSYPELVLGFETSTTKRGLDIKVDECAEVTVGVFDLSDGNELIARVDMKVKLESEYDRSLGKNSSIGKPVLKMFSNKDCSKEVKDIEIKGSESSVLFWIKSPGAGNFILDAKAKNVLSPISFDVQVIAD